MKFGFAATPGVIAPESKGGAMAWNDDDYEDDEPVMYCPKCEQNTVYLVQTGDQLAVHCDDPTCKYVYLTAEESVS